MTEPAHVDFSTTLDERTKAFTVAAAMLGLLLAALDQTIVATAMPRISQELHGLELYTWVTTAYVLASTAMVPVYGKLGDLYGRKAVLLAGIGLFLAASVACGAAGSMTTLVAMRAVQGLGAAALTSTAFAVVADLYEPRRRARVQGIFGAVFGLSSVVGPVLGGLLTQHVSWRAVFYVNVPVGAVAVAFILAKMPSLRRGLEASVDWAGAALVVLASVTLMLALSLDKRAHAWTSPEVLGLLAAGVASTALFLRVEARAQDPVLPLRLFANPAFAASALASFLFGGLFFAAILFVPLFMTMVLGVSDTEAGTTLMPLSLVMSPAAIVGGRLAARLGRVKVVMLATLAAAAGAYLLLSTMDGASSRLSISARLALLGIALGPNLSLLTIAIQGSVGPRDIGIATSARQFFQQLGGAFGAALLGAVLATTLPAALERRLAPVVAQLPAEQRAGLDPMRLGARSYGVEGSSAEARKPVPGPVLEAVREAYAESITRLFLWAMGIALVTLAAATRVRDPASMRPPEGPPAHVEA